MPIAGGALDVLRALITSISSGARFPGGPGCYRLLAAALLLCVIASQPARGATTATWLGGGGSWTDDPHWSTGMYPSNGALGFPPGTTFNVFIDAGMPEPSDVSLSIGVIIDNLSISSGDALEVMSGGGPTIKMYPGAGTVSNAGSIMLEGGSLEFDGTGVAGVPMGTLTGSGTIFMTGGSIKGHAGTETLTTDTTIMGFGSVGAKNLINHGIINASLPMSVLTVSSGALGSVKNVGTAVPGSGTLMASGGGTLALATVTFDQTDAAHPGTIKAIGGSEVVLGSFAGGVTTIKGGTLSTDMVPASTITNIKTATLNGVTLFTPLYVLPPPLSYATYTQADGAITNLQGTITNGGVIEVASSGMGGPSKLLLDSVDATLSGMGSIRLKGTATGIPFDPNFVKIQGTPAARLTIGSLQTITGSGQFGSHARVESPKLTNHGTIAAMISSTAPPGAPPEGMTFYPLILDPFTMLPVPDAMVNDGTLKANENSFLTFAGGTVSNSSAAMGGLIVAKGTMTPGIVSPGTVTLQEGDTVNGGTILLDGFMSQLLLNSGTARPTTLTNSSGGIITTVAPSTANTIGGAITNSGPSMIKVADGSALTMDNASLGGSVTNSAFIGVGTGVFAAAPATLTIKSGSLTNFVGATNGTIGVASNGTLMLTGDATGNAIINGGAVSLLGAGSMIKLNNGTIHAGTLSNIAGGFISTVNGSNGNRLGGIVHNPVGAGIGVVMNSTLQLETGGVYDNVGTIALNGAPGGVSILQLNGSGAGGNVSLTGGGGLFLGGDSVNNQVLGAGERLINVDNLIYGGGLLGVGRIAITNKSMGTIQSTGPLGPLVIQPNAAGLINGGTIKTQGATLDLQRGPFANVDGATKGTIQANAGDTILLEGIPAASAVIDNGLVQVMPNATLELSEGTIHNGLLTNLNGGTINSLAGSANTLGGTVNNNLGGIINVQAGSTLNLETSGVFNNTGLININAAAGSNLRANGANGTVTLNGGGTITLLGGGASIVGTGTERLVNQNNTIDGGGSIGAGLISLTNRGLIDVTGLFGMTIQPNADGAINGGTMQARGGPLTLNGGTFTNFEGATDGLIQTVGAADILNVTGNAIIDGGNVTISNPNGGTINLTNGTIHNGTLNNSPAGIVTTTAGAVGTLGGTVNNPVGGVIAAVATSTLKLETGGTYNNAGAINLNAANAAGATNLQLDGDGGVVTLVGGGTVTLTGDSSISGVAGNERLVNLDNTINGTGTIGLHAMSLTNDGKIDASAAPGITISANSGGVINGGFLQASNGAILTLDGGIYTNTIGVIRAQTVESGSEVQLKNGVTINGGNLSNNPGDLVRVVDEAVLNTLTNKGNIALNEGSILDLTGTVTNKGTITLPATSFVTQLKLLNGDVTLDGTGKVELLHSALNQILAANGLDRLTVGSSQTIHGTGNIGVGAMALTNSGKIIADQATDLTIQPNLAGFLNKGTLRAEAGNILNIIGGYKQTAGDTNVLGTLNVTAGPFNAGGGTLSGTGQSNISGGFSLTGNFTKQDAGTATISGPESFSSGKTFNINGGKVKFNVTFGSVSVGSGVTANVASGATLELAGSIAALAFGAGRANIVNDSATSGVVVSGTNQAVGGIDGSGTTRVNAGSDLTANHIIQSVLEIDGSDNSPAQVTLAASDTAGNPLAVNVPRADGLILAEPLATGEPLDIAGVPLSNVVASSGLPGLGGLSNVSSMAGEGLGLRVGLGATLAVPEPSSLLLLGLGALCCTAGFRWRMLARRAEKFHR